MLLLLLLSLLAWLLPIQPILAASKQPQGKIYNGQTASIKDYGFMVTLRHSSDFKCGGAIISPSCVLTAAHCLQRKPVHNLFVYTQQQCLRDAPAQVRQASYVVIPPNFDKNLFLNKDLAVLRLRKAFDLGKRNSSMRSISIDYNELKPRANLTLLGWGMTSSGPHNPNQCLQSAQVQLQPPKKCQQTIGQVSKLTENMFCALGANATDACPGDSGGPVLHNGRIVGIVSWGEGCGSGLPGVYTRLSSDQMTWYLRQFVRQHC